MVRRGHWPGPWRGGVERAAQAPSGLPPPASDHAHLADLHALLADDRSRTRERIADLTRDVTSIVEATRLTATDDEHDPEGSTIAFERSQTTALLTAATKHLAEVDAALSRIADGTYGRCERCGKPVPRQRLLARPAARTCIACADQGARARH